MMIDGAPPVWSIYLLRDDTNSLYTGISTDVGRRYREHLDGTAAKYTRSRKGLLLVYVCEIGSRSLALRAESRLRRLPKKNKEAIIRQGLGRCSLLDRLGLESGATR